MLSQQLESAPHAGQHTKGEHIDLHELESIDVVLVPLYNLAVLHGGGFNGNKFIKPVTGEHETARMLGKMARGSDQLTRQTQCQPQPSIARIKIEPFGMFLVNTF